MNVIEGKMYKHKVHETIYLVLYVAAMEVDESPCVVYQNTADKNRIWVRPLGEFKQKFERLS